MKEKIGQRKLMLGQSNKASVEEGRGSAAAAPPLDLSFSFLSPCTPSSSISSLLIAAKRDWLTSPRISTHDQRILVVDPLDLEPALLALPLPKRSDQVPRLELRREVGEGEDSSHGGTPT
jgi:hypothetical protein